jgi:hypothetical protein
MAYRESPAANEAQRRSASYELAELDREFLLGDSMRGVRLQLEFAKVEEELEAWGVRSTIVVFCCQLICPFRQTPSEWQDDAIYSRQSPCRFDRDQPRIVRRVYARFGHRGHVR